MEKFIQDLNNAGANTANKLIKPEDLGDQFRLVEKWRKFKTKYGIATQLLIHNMGWMYIPERMGKLINKDEPPPPGMKIKFLGRDQARMNTPLFEVKIEKEEEELEYLQYGQPLDSGFE